MVEWGWNQEGNQVKLRRIQDTFELPAIDAGVVKKAKLTQHGYVEPPAPESPKPVFLDGPDTTFLELRSTRFKADGIDFLKDMEGTIDVLQSLRGLIHGRSAIDSTMRSRKNRTMTSLWRT